MKSAKEWKEEFCNRHIINVRGEEVESFLADVQRDAMQVWQPIETAPKDKPCIFYQEARELFNGYNIGPIMIIGEYDKYFFPSHISWQDGDCEMDKPTHWMPLLENPK